MRMLTSDGRQVLFQEHERRADRPSTIYNRLAPYLRYYSTVRLFEQRVLIPTVEVVFEEELTADHFLTFGRAVLSRCRVALLLFVSCQASVDETDPFSQSWPMVRSQELSRSQ